MTIEYTTITPNVVPTAATSFAVRMRDGVRLATDVYQPDDGTSEGPTILIRLPYDKNGDYTFIPLIAEYMIGRGYRVVAQDVRGKFRSEGEALLFVNEVEDGYDTIEWITQQPWSDGAVAMWGDSYYGYTQWAAASSNHPALKAIAPRVTGTGLGEYPTADPGALTRDVQMSIILLYPLTHFHSADTYEWEPDWSTRPYLRDLEAFQEQLGRRSVSFDLWYPNPVILRRFRSGTPFEARSIPVLNTIGWWDNCAPWSWRDHQSALDHPSWAHNEYLLIESIDHENNHFGAEPHGEEESSLRAMLPGYLDPALDFFDVFVRGWGDPESIPKVRWSLANTEGYRHAQSWPPPGRQQHELHLSADSRLTPQPGSHSQDATWKHDPDDLVPSSVPNPFAYLEFAPDEARLADRDDVLVFTADAASSDENLAGPVTFHASVSSTGPRTDVFVRVYDLSPDGRQTRIARGQVHIMDTTTGSPTDIDVDLGQVGYLLRAGHRLRLHVHSSDFPEFVPEPGTDEDPWAAVATAVTIQTIRVGGLDGAVLRFGTLADPGPAHPLTKEKE